MGKAIYLEFKLLYTPFKGGEAVKRLTFLICECKITNFSRIAYISCQNNAKNFVVFMFFLNFVENFCKLP